MASETPGAPTEASEQEMDEKAEIRASELSEVTEAVASANLDTTSKPVREVKLPWTPDPAEILQMFEYLHKNQMFTFSWECPGRRKPGEVEQAATDDTSVPQSEGNEASADDFDFEEESTPVVRRPSKVLQHTPKGSAKKKITSFAGILSNMERHRILDRSQPQKDPND